MDAIVETLLNDVFKAPGVIGALIVDIPTGFPLASRGFTGIQKDANELVSWYKNKDEPQAALIRNTKVLLSREDNLLIAVYKSG